MPVGRIKKYYQKLLHSHASTEEVAQGMALGVFISFTPMLLIHVPLGIFLAAILKKNEIATMIGVWVSNPLTMVPLYYATYKVGIWVLRMEPVPFGPESMKSFFTIGGDILMPLWAGGVIVGLIAALVSYWLTKKIYPRFLHRRKKNHPVPHP